MDTSPSTASLAQPAQSYTLQVDFSWKAFKSLITEKDDPQSKPTYIVDYKSFKPHLVFKRADDNSIFASGTLHTFSINADCEIHGQTTTLKALKRFKTEYMHLSYAFSDTNTPVPMTWTSHTGFKTWDFICLDEKGIAVAKFSANAWAMTKVGYIEFMGSKATISDAVRDEILLSFFGAIFSRPGKNVSTRVSASDANNPVVTN